MSRPPTRRSPLLALLLLAMQLVVGCGGQNQRTEPQIQLKSTAQAGQEAQGTTRVLVNGTNVTIHHHDGSVTQLSDVDPDDTLVVEAPGKVEVVNAQGTQTYDMGIPGASATVGAPATPGAPGAPGAPTTATTAIAATSTGATAATTGSASASATATGTAAPQAINSATEMNGVPVSFDGGVPGQDSVGDGGDTSDDGADDPADDDTDSGPDIQQEAGDTVEDGEVDEDGFVSQTLGDQDLSQAGVAGAKPS